MQISEFPAGDFGSNRQAISVETDRPFRSKAAPDPEGVLVRLQRTAGAQMILSCLGCRKQVFLSLLSSLVVVAGCCGLCE
jgi:hypothetical protein